MTALPDYLFHESLQRCRISHIPHKPVSGFDIDDVHRGAFRAESIRDGFADTVRAAGHHRDFPFKTLHDSLPHGFQNGFLLCSGECYAFYPGYISFLNHGDQIVFASNESFDHCAAPACESSLAHAALEQNLEILLFNDPAGAQDFFHKADAFKDHGVAVGHFFTAPLCIYPKQITAVH